MVPLVLSKIVNILSDLGKVKFILKTQDGVEKVIELLKSYKFNITLFKENLLELQPNESLIKRYEKVTPSLKASLTKKYNECFKTSMIKKKKKGGKEEVVKYDEDGEIIEEVDNSEEESKQEEDEVVLKETKKSKKAKK